MTDQLSLRLVPDELWDLVQPHLPKFRPRPQGGGTDALICLDEVRQPREPEPGALRAVHGPSGVIATVVFRDPGNNQLEVVALT